MSLLQENLSRLSPMSSMQYGNVNQQRQVRVLEMVKIGLFVSQFGYYAILKMAVFCNTNVFIRIWNCLKTVFKYGLIHVYANILFYSEVLLKKISSRDI